MSEAVAAAAVSSKANAVIGMRADTIEDMSKPARNRRERARTRGEGKKRRIETASKRRERGREDREER